MEQLNALSNILFKKPKFKNCTEAEINYIITNYYKLISIK